jgi:hypothetical protein
MRPKLLIGSMIDRQPINNGSRLHFWGMTNGISDVADSTYIRACVAICDSVGICEQTDERGWMNQSASKCDRTNERDLFCGEYSFAVNA